MLNLPPQPFKTFFVGDDDEFVKEALRRRNSSERCWCGSNKAYKDCHKERASQKRITLGKLLKDQRKVFWKRRGCMHPDASTSSCRGKIIDSHTIQRKGPLKELVDPSNHVQHIYFDATTGSLRVKPISWRKASVFPGFCAHHDSELFKELESEPFIGSQKQCFLQFFRNVCSELYKKRALIDSLKFQREVMDRGRSIHDQIEIQLSVHKSLEGQRKSVEELEALEAMYHAAFKEEDWESFDFKIYFFEGKIDLISSSVIQVDYDFFGHQFVDLFDLSQNAESVSYSTINTEFGGAIVFGWPKVFKNVPKFVDSFDKIDDQEKGDIFAQYCFLNAEHTFFSKKWWEMLSKKQRDDVFRLYRCTYYEGGRFTVSQEPLVSWRFRSPS